VKKSGRKKKDVVAVPVEPSERPAPEARVVAIGLIDESPTNPRKEFNEQKLAELGESILRHGVLQPILLRPKKGGRYELVAGHRRHRAARSVALETIPAIVQELTDKEVLEIQIVENLQREGLTPLEEAEGYAQLIRAHGYDADSLALKIGKSRGYVYGRMKLVALCPDARKVLLAGDISHSVALLLARIPDAKLQKEALRAVQSTQLNDGMSYRRAAEFIKERFMRRLGDAPFDREDANLVKAAGPCSTCPLLLGNQPDVTDKASADVCTSPGCFQKKVDAHIKVLAREKGWAMLSATETRRAFPYHSGNLSYDSPYVDAASKSGYDAKAKTFAQIAPEAPIVLARDPEGKLRKLIARKHLPKKFQPRSQQPARPRDDTKWKRDQELRQAKQRARTASLLRGLAAAELTVESFWPWVVQAIAVDRYFEAHAALARIGVKAKASNRYSMKPATVLPAVKALPVNQQIALLCDLLFGVGAEGYQGGDDEEGLVTDAFLASLGVDLETDLKRVEDEFRAKWGDAKKGQKAKGPAARSAKAKPVAKAKKKTTSVAPVAIAPTEHRIDVREGETAPYVVQGRVSRDHEWSDIGRRFGSLDVALEVFPEAWLPPGVADEGDGELQIVRQRIAEIAEGAGRRCS